MNRNYIKQLEKEEKIKNDMLDGVLRKHRNKKLISDGEFNKYIKSETKDLDQSTIGLETIRLELLNNISGYRLPEKLRILKLKSINQNSKRVKEFGIQPSIINSLNGLNSNISGIQPRPLNIEHSKYQSIIDIATKNNRDGYTNETIIAIEMDQNKYTKIKHDAILHLRDQDHLKQYISIFLKSIFATKSLIFLYEPTPDVITSNLNEIASFENPALFFESVDFGVSNSSDKYSIESRRGSDGGKSIDSDDISIIKDTGPNSPIDLGDPKNPIAEEKDPENPLNLTKEEMLVNYHIGELEREQQEQLNIEIHRDMEKGVLNNYTAKKLLSNNDMEDLTVAKGNDNSDKAVNEVINKMITDLDSKFLNLVNLSEQAHKLYKIYDINITSKLSKEKKDELLQKINIFFEQINKIQNSVGISIGNYIGDYSNTKKYISLSNESKRVVLNILNKYYNTFFFNNVIAPKYYLNKLLDILK